VTTAQAKEALLAYRPGTADGLDPEVQEALELAKEDSDLRAWFQGQLRFQNEVRRELRKMHVPSDLRQKILSSHKVIRGPFWRTREALLAVAALAIVVVGIFLWSRSRDDARTFASFRSRMVGEVLRVYSMDIVTNNPAVVRNYLAQNGAPADFTLPSNLAKLPVLGGARLYWESTPVAMICFQGPGKETLFLFVVSKNNIPARDLPAGARIETVKGLSSASWESADNIYVLAGNIPASALPQIVTERKI
jgi:hypothetical protein